MHTVGILGGGFGLYGYLPAACGIAGVQVALPERYRGTVRERAELEHLESRVHWVAADHELFTVADTLVIARRPADQVALVHAMPAHSRVRRIVLEKPIAPTPREAAALLDAIRARGLGVRAGFSMAYTSWAAALPALLHAQGGQCRVSWQFMAHHFTHDRHGWKREHQEGGAALRFYGIQLLAALTRHEGTSLRVLGSSLHRTGDGSVAAWTCELEVDRGATVRIAVNSQAAVARFAIGAGPEQHGRSVVAWADPFRPDAPTVPGAPNAATGATRATGATPEPDRRIRMLAEILDPDAPSDYAWIARSTELWNAIESASDSVNFASESSGAVVSAPDMASSSSRSAAAESGAA